MFVEYSTKTGNYKPGLAGLKEIVISSYPPGLNAKMAMPDSQWYL